MRALVIMLAHSFVRVNSFYKKTMTVNERIAELRKTHSLTQKQLAESISASERGIQNYELGLRKPTLEIAVALADFFDVSLDYLVGRSDNPKRF